MNYEFTHDWFSWNIASFEKHLAEGFMGEPVKALEIGSHEGRSTTWLLDNVLTHPQARIVCVDIEPVPLFWSNIMKSSHNKVQFKQGFSREVLCTIPFGYFDFVYIDGSHWTVDVLEDAVLSFRRAKVGAVIAFDDYLWDDPKFNQFGTPRPAIDAFLALYSDRIEVLEHGHQIWVRKVSD